MLSQKEMATTKIETTRGSGKKCSSKIKYSPRPGSS